MICHCRWLNVQNMTNNFDGQRIHSLREGTMPTSFIVAILYCRSFNMAVLGSRAGTGQQASHMQVILSASQVILSAYYPAAPPPGSGHRCNARACSEPAIDCHDRSCDPSHFKVSGGSASQRGDSWSTLTDHMFGQESGSTRVCHNQRWFDLFLVFIVWFEATVENRKALHFLIQSWSLLSNWGAARPNDSVICCCSQVDHDAFVAVFLLRTHSYVACNCWLDPFLAPMVYFVLEIQSSVFLSCSCATCSAGLWLAVISFSSVLLLLDRAVQN